MDETTPEGKRGPGQPSKYGSIDLEQVEKLAGLGLIDSEIALVLGISEATLNNYKLEHPEFLESLKRGKLKADQNVIISLYKRAIGYKEDDTYFSTFQGMVTATPYKKVIVPDVTAQIFWLKNRRPQDFRDKIDLQHSGSIRIESVDVAKLPTDKLDRLARGENPELVLADTRN